MCVCVFLFLFLFFLVSFFLRGGGRVRFFFSPLVFVRLFFSLFFGEGGGWCVCVCVGVCVCVCVFFAERNKGFERVVSFLYLFFLWGGGKHFAN